tara:strand:+ start:7971 stop:8405 length:435 start_codon:yes stop_codon:yes gene_type:complete
MKAADRKIVLNLLDRFRETEAFANGDRLISGTDCALDSEEKVLRPTLSYFTLDQIRASETRSPVPTWIVDVASPTDRFYLMEDKVTEYFQNGVQVAWEVFAPFERVRIFRPVQETLELTGDDLCDAEPALSGLSISVADIFKPR